MNRIVKLLDGRTVQIDNNGNIISEVSTFEKLDKNNYTPHKTINLPTPDYNTNISGKINDIDLGDINKSDNTAQVETPVENTVRTTPATSRRRTVNSVTPTPKGGKNSNSSSGYSSNKGGKKGNKDVTSKDTTTYNAGTLNNVTVTGKRKNKQDTPTTIQTQNKGYYKGTRYSKNGNFKFVHKGDGTYDVYIKSHNSSGWNLINNAKRKNSVSKDEQYSIDKNANITFDSRNGMRIYQSETKESAQNKQTQQKKI